MLCYVYVIGFGCIVNYFMQHQHTYVLSQYPTIQESLRLMRKREDKDGKCHGNK